MKKFVSNYKMGILVLLMLVGTANLLFAYENGDFRARKSGCWFGDNKMWERYYYGQWYYTTQNPSGLNCNIYIPSGLEVYLTAIEDNNYGVDVITIVKKLIIEEDAWLYSSPNPVYVTIDLFGDIKVDGRLGTDFCYYEFDSAITLNTKGNNESKIYGIGDMYIGKMNLYADCNISIHSVIEEAEFKTGVSCRLDNGDVVYDFGNMMVLGTVYIQKPNAKLLVNTDAVVRKEIYVDSGTNYMDAPTLVVESDGNLKLYHTNNHKNICLGLNGGTASLVVKGNYRNYAKITGFDESYWDITYSDNNNLAGSGVYMEFKYATFENMKREGILIRRNVNINNDAISYCKFKYPEPIWGSCMLNIEGTRELSMDNIVFQGVSPRFGYNIHYFNSRSGNIEVTNYSENLSGECCDLDPFNRVIWIEGREEKNDIAESSNVTKLDNYPNPFNPTTTISYQLEKESDVNLTIFNVKGQKVTQLVNELKSTGTHSVIWNGIDEKGNSVPSGVYFYRIEAGDFTETKRMMLLK